MKKQIHTFATACVLLGTLASCHLSKRTAATATTSDGPRFIDDIYLSRHNKNPDYAASQKPSTHTPTARTVTTNKHTHTTAVTYTESPSEPANPSNIRNKYAEILGIKPKEIDNYPLYEFIENWYGTRHRIGGCDKNGIDCSGFAQRLYSDVYGIDLLRTSMEQFSSCKRFKSVGEAEEGDLVFFRVHSKHITHVGVYLTNNFFVHSSTSGGVMISSLNDDYWHKYYAGMGRVPKSEKFQ